MGPLRRRGDAQTTNGAYLAADIMPLAAQIAGYVRTVPVGDCRRVRAGEVVVEPVDDDHRARVHQAEGAAATAQGRIAELEASRRLQLARIRGAGAQLAPDEAVPIRNRLEAERQRALVASGISGTRQAVERADADAQRAAATLAGDRADLDAAREQIAVFDAQIEQQKGALDHAAALAPARARRCGPPARLCERVDRILAMAQQDPAQGPRPLLDRLTTLACYAA